jgi:hypothetical protein
MKSAERRLPWGNAGHANWTTNQSLPAALFPTKNDFKFTNLGVHASNACEIAANHPE